MNIVQHIQQQLTSFFQEFPQSPIVIGYSGGVDSQVLLHALATAKKSSKFANQLSVIHVHHGLNAQADNWAQSCEQTCQQLSIPCQVLKIEINKSARQSLEALAREARYQAIAQVINQDAVLVTGHHGNDQLETLLLALKRGSGVSGLKAMTHSSEVFGINLVRPLLNFSRQQIEQYAEQKQLTWVEDSSNTDQSYDRNFIRHSITPVLTERWPQFISQVQKSTEHLAQAEQLLFELAELDYANCQLNNEWGKGLAIASLKQLSQARFNNLLRYWLKQQQQLMPSSQQLQQIWQQLHSEQPNQLTVQLAQCCIRRYQQQLLATPIYQDVTAFSAQVEQTQLEHELTLNLPDQLGQLSLIKKAQGAVDHQADTSCCLLQAPKAGQQITIGFSHQNPMCLPEYRQHRRALKKVLQELNIPTWQRQRIPFLYYDDELVAAIGYFRCQPFLPAGQQVLAISWQK